jgi:hypothetical protein
MYGNYQVGLAVPQIHLKGGNFGCSNIEMMRRYMNWQEG